MANPNIVNVTSILGKTAVQAIGTSATAIVQNGAASGTIVKINSLVISNVDGAVAADVTVDHYRSATARHLAKAVTVPAAATLVVVDKNTSIYLEESDDLRLTASAAGDLEAICSYEIIS